MTLELALNRTGHIFLDHTEDESHALSSAVTRRISDAFATGQGQGLLWLGANELTTPLSPSLSFGRELAQGFMRRWCSTADLADCWETCELPAPDPDLMRLLDATPPMRGAEYLTLPCLHTLWQAILEAARAEIRQAGDVSAWLENQHPGWHLVGRICFHLAENKASADFPFAFIATYTSDISPQARLQHIPLARALQEYAGDRNAMLALLLPIQHASRHSTWLRQMLDTGVIYRSAAWTASQAYLFLKEIRTLEENGIIVRVPDWWKPRQPPRIQARVSIGRSVAGMGLEAMLDFDVRLSLGDEILSEAELYDLSASPANGLVRLKGQWVELDREQLDNVLTHWKKVQRAAGRDGISFLEGMRMLAGASLDATEDTSHEITARWTKVVAGEWMQSILEGLREPGGDAHPGDSLKARLRPYQLHGVRWLWCRNQLELGGCLADDMGLGKTIQMLSLLLLARQVGDTGPHLLVVPASLIGNWHTEMTRFTPDLTFLVAHGMAHPGKSLSELDHTALSGVNVVLTSYGTLQRLTWLHEVHWSIVILDEAQAIKNPGTRQTKQVKALNSRVRFAMTGTPVENRPGDLWSLFDFLSPGLLGTAKEFAGFINRLSEDKLNGYAPLKKLVQPYILRRMKSDKSIIDDLPDKTEVKAWCSLSRVQISLYRDAVEELAQRLKTAEGIERRGIVLGFLIRFKQICNHPDQWLGHARFEAESSGKFARLRELSEEIASRQEKLLVFTQFREMVAPLHNYLQTIFGRAGLMLHGGTPVKFRKNLVEQFQQDNGPPFFVLSVRAGGTGLTLTAASHVIHFDRWWNPAVENQATDRAYRIGQKKNVLVHKFVCRGTIEEKIDLLIDAKAGLSGDILGGNEISLTEMSNTELMRMVSLDLNSALLEN